ncbi:nuclear transport factor 2 family protein [uncultured Acetobacteroides sp.]|uniref:YybH family protein n=1 Tax=uncultured Acetobacteroides sp. TaxID=1760811 RepID=UPI0029F5724E|nr:nuclear transport factor 2 family protein [uncultured Acetobacteroides sp.]
MKKITLLTLLVMTATASFSQSANAEISATIVALEKAALEKWNQGDPSGYINLSAPDVVYFDPFIPQRLDGIEALKELYKPLTGQIHVSRYEMVNPKVQATSSMAVLTFNLVSFGGETPQRWNCTEVYRLEKDNQWKIVQTHWSFTTPSLK